MSEAGLEQASSLDNFMWVFYIGVGGQKHIYQSSVTLFSFANLPWLYSFIGYSLLGLKYSVISF